MPRACPVECHDVRYTPTKKSRLDATALSRGGFTFAATVASNVRLHGTGPWHLNRFLVCDVAVSVRLHGTSPWHLNRFLVCDVAASVKAPRDKPVASLQALLLYSLKTKSPEAFAGGVNKAPVK